MKKIYNISFSPTGTSMKVANQITSIFDGETTVIDLCEPMTGKLQLEQDSICVFSMPCYYGRIPQTAAERLLHIHGTDTPAVVCVTFGNRAYEDALLELADLCEKLGFKVIAGGAMVTEHNIMHVYGQGRPDASDQVEISKFAKDIFEKLCAGDYSRPQILGNYPYKEESGNKAPILVNEKSCTNCGICASKCPVQAVSADGLHMDMERCINCMRCITVCPGKNRSLPDPFLSAIIQKMKPVCEGRKENKFYI